MLVNGSRIKTHIYTRSSDLRSTLRSRHTNGYLPRCSQQYNHIVYTCATNHNINNNNRDTHIAASQLTERSQYAVSPDHCLLADVFPVARSSPRGMSKLSPWGMSSGSRTLYHCVLNAVVCQSVRLSDQLHRRPIKFVSVVVLLEAEPDIRRHRERWRRGGIN